MVSMVRPADVDRAACAGDRDALVALYNATDGAYWRNRVNWLTETAPIGNWFGVSTDGDGCVVVLYLGNNGLSGQLPPELGNLDTLDLDGNRLTGRYPSNWATLAI